MLSARRYEVVFSMGPRRSSFIDVGDGCEEVGAATPSAEYDAFEFYDLVYRTLCAVLFNFVPTSGHPGGSISSGRIVHGILYNLLDYDLSDPEAPGADIIAYAAGHKALGLYAGWALRNEVARISAPSILARDVKLQLRYEDLLGFRRNPTAEAPLLKQFGAKTLDGHPNPNTPFVPLATGASGVGTGSSFGLALGALDYYGPEDPPMVHAIEGEGGMTPGRVAEALAMASAAGLKNLVLHVDFNQSSIDSDRVCREDDIPGDYVQWTPAELLRLNDWNVISVPNGMDFRQVFAAQSLLSRMSNDQPTAIVYRTVKGWRYGIEGRQSHGAGHGFCSQEFYASLKEFEDRTGVVFPRHAGDLDPASVEGAFWECLKVIRQVMESHRSELDTLAAKLQSARERYRRSNRRPRADAPNVAALHDSSAIDPTRTPAELVMEPGTSTTLRGTLGNVLHHLNKESNGAFFISASDLLDSTSVKTGSKAFPDGYYHSVNNPGARTLSVGGICEDGMGAVLTGLSTYGAHVGVGSSYAAFIAPLQHVAARLHGIGNQGTSQLTGKPFKPYIMVCAHAGFKTGEDGPTHAEPQTLQLLQDNFPPGVCMTLTPWDPQEIWPMMSAALVARPAVIAVFVTRPTEKVIDRRALGLPPAADAVKGVYPMRLADLSKPSQGTIVLQESGATYAFVEDVLPRLNQAGFNLNVYYIASSELFSGLPAQEQESIFPMSHRQEAMGITGFTMTTMYRWVISESGRRDSVHAFTSGRYAGSGQALDVLKEAGLDGKSQFDAIARHVERREAA